jgi:hypothetical protein
MDGDGTRVMEAPIPHSLDDALDDALDDDRPLLRDAAALRAVAAERGHVFLPGLLDPDRVLALRREVLAVCASMGLLDDHAPVEEARARRDVRLDPYVSPEWIELQRRVALLDEFAALSVDTRLLAVLETLFGTAPAPHCGDVCRVFLPGRPEATTPAHQDYFFLQRSPLPDPHRIWSAWTPLGDCPRELGGIAVLPGSHARGLWPHRELDARGPQIEPPADAGWAGADFRVGDVLLINCFTVHRALDNRSPDRLRLSVDFRYQPGPSG